MELWRGSLPDFVRSADSGAIVGDMVGRFYHHHMLQPGESEVRSWKNSLKAFAEAARPNAKNIGVVVEYHLPLHRQRIDVMLFGQSRQGNPNSLIVELKQWSRVAIEDEFALNVIVDDCEHPHPSQQALDYVGFLEEVHSAYNTGELSAQPCAYCHNLGETSVLEDRRFESLLGASPLFKSGDATQLGAFIDQQVGAGDGIDLMQEVSVGRFKPSKKVIASLDAVLNQDDRWHLLDAQRTAYNAILADVQRLNARKRRSAVLVRGGPGTGKTVIAIQLLADALRLGFTAAHSTGGKAFTTVLRSKFKGADKLFIWNHYTRTAPFQGLDLLLVDEAHRLRETSDNPQYTPMAQRNQRSQTEELLNASKVTVFLLDENQFMRPNEIGRSALIRLETTQLGVPLKEYDLEAQFRCGGCIEYVHWVDHLLGFRTAKPLPWGSRYRFDLVGTPSELEEMMAVADDAEERARLVAGFCWKWSNPNPDSTLVEDVVIGGWRRPWNRKPSAKKTYKAENHPYTLWAETDAGKTEIGCIYSAQGFEFDRVGVIWGHDLVWRSGQWVASHKATFDPPLRRKTLDDEHRRHLLRNAYRVLLTRGIRGTTVLCLDEETGQHIAAELKGMQ